MRWFPTITITNLTTLPTELVSDRSPWKPAAPTSSATAWNVATEVTLPATAQRLLRSMTSYSKRKWTAKLTTTTTTMAYPRRRMWGRRGRKEGRRKKWRPQEKPNPIFLPAIKYQRRCLHRHRRHHQRRRRRLPRRCFLHFSRRKRITITTVRRKLVLQRGIQPSWTSLSAPLNLLPHHHHHHHQDHHHHCHHRHRLTWPLRRQATPRNSVQLLTTLATTTNWNCQVVRHSTAIDSQLLMADQHQHQHQHQHQQQHQQQQRNTSTYTIIRNTRTTTHRATNTTTSHPAPLVTTKAAMKNWCWRWLVGRTRPSCTWAGYNSAAKGRASTSMVRGWLRTSSSSSAAEKLPRTGRGRSSTTGRVWKFSSPKAFWPLLRSGVPAGSAPTTATQPSYRNNTSSVQRPPFYFNNNNNNNSLPLILHHRLFHTFYQPLHDNNYLISVWIFWIFQWLIELDWSHDWSPVIDWWIDWSHEVQREVLRSKDNRLEVWGSHFCFNPVDAV